MKRLEFLKSYVEHKSDGSRIEFLAGNFYLVDEAKAPNLCTMAVARDPEAPEPDVEFPAPEPSSDATGFSA
jgi:hypothetical protein